MVRVLVRDFLRHEPAAQQTRPQCIIVGEQLTLAGPMHDGRLHICVALGAVTSAAGADD